MSAKKIFTNLVSVIDEIEVHKEDLVHKWVMTPGVKKRFDKFGIQPRFFSEHFGIKVLEYFIGVVRGDKALGNCPVIFSMLDFFKQKEISLHDLFIICANLKNRLILHFTQKNADVKILAEIMVVMDLNFEGVMLGYVNMFYQIKDTTTPAPPHKSSLEIDVETLRSEPVQPAENKVVSQSESRAFEIPDSDWSKAKDLIDRIDVCSLNLTEDSRHEVLPTLIQDMIALASLFESHNETQSMGSTLLRTAHAIDQRSLNSSSGAGFDTLEFKIENLANDLMVWQETVLSKGSSETHTQQERIQKLCENIISLLAE